MLRFKAFFFIFKKRKRKKEKIKIEIKENNIMNLLLMRHCIKKYNNKESRVILAYIAPTTIKRKQTFMINPTMWDDIKERG